MVYAFSLGASEFMRARRNKTTKTTTNMSKAKAFSDGVDDIISARDEIGLVEWYGCILWLCIL